MGQEKKMWKWFYQGEKENKQTDWIPGRKNFWEGKSKVDPSLGNCLVSQILLRLVRGNVTVDWN